MNMQIETKHVKDLLPAEYNPRKNLKPGDKEYEKLKRSIEQFGYVEPVIWNQATGRIVGGHQRLKVLMDMGITEVECVIVQMALTFAQINAMIRRIGMEVGE
jgi:ParB-like chromosome segregation protein Spo0J